MHDGNQFKQSIIKIKVRKVKWNIYIFVVSFFAFLYGLFVLYQSN